MNLIVENSLLSPTRDQWPHPRLVLSQTHPALLPGGGGPAILGIPSMTRVGLPMEYEVVEVIEEVAGVVVIQVQGN